MILLLIVKLSVKFLVESLGTNLLMQLRTIMTSFREKLSLLDELSNTSRTVNNFFILFFLNNLLPRELSQILVRMLVASL